MFNTQLLTNISLVLSGILSVFLNKRSILTIFVSIELILLSVNLNFILASVYLDDFYGQIISLFVLTVAAAEAGLGLAILILYYRINGNVFIDSAINLKS